jgi:hypothetical protein
MSLAASIQITDQDIFQQSSVKGAANIGQLAATPDGRTFAYASAGGTLVRGQVTQPAAVTANYVTRTITTAAALNARQVTVVLGTTVAADAFAGFWLVVTDTTAAGAGQGTYYVTGNTAATAGNSNTTVVTIRGGLSVALTTSSVVGLYPSQESAVVQHTAAVAIPVVGAPVISITSGNFFWNQVGGYASILSDGAITKNAGGIASDAVAGSVEIEVAATVTQRAGYAPELTVDTKYSPFVLQCV